MPNPKLVKDDAVRYPARKKGLLGILVFLVGYLLTFLWIGDASGLRSKRSPSIEEPAVSRSHSE
ncbi:hypothetical protein [Haladaptatus sp. DFWS20]|uniref:hypothetical protein n=1 Tax=Haladaptatus sp. DFWS20 TaxID=3403467 RepID=UPI003EBF9D36